MASAFHSSHFLHDDATEYAANIRKQSSDHAQSRYLDRYRTYAFVGRTKKIGVR